ncbi:hypothetical protein CC1G_15612 [Coprinopsis cinerea okayama7|uniref:Uncharacterized protein n=1 Tax=Coprinopsis cinerea (strain Okayama-7 / 130 / ATCC MYA-4618 / FGSC 9003) TaxID=240176 RepID=D6RNE2_COPC7|nr:hypothetical protein CC1G_15612 [Coprinopsis cinerea okayama7\|eukprot:XP_002911070.1 hypothetical protein CC1G_15612 [Coprinopsis cinerea okayama7\
MSKLDLATQARPYRKTLGSSSRFSLIFASKLDRIVKPSSQARDSGLSKLDLSSVVNVQA